MSPFPATTPRLVLRPFQQADLAAFAAYRGDPEVARYQSWTAFDDQDAAAFLAEQRRLAFDTDGTWFQIAVERREDRVLVGDVAVRFWDDGRQAELGVTFAVEHQRQGYAGEAVGRVVEILFARLKKHRIVATVDALNLRVQHLLAIQGFRREAHLRENILFKGVWSDEYLYALLAREWQARRSDAVADR